MIQVSLVVFLVMIVGACKPSSKTLEPIAEVGVKPGGNDDLNSSLSIRAELTGVPEGQSRQTKLSIQVSGSNLVSYSYKIGPSLTTECELAFDYTRKIISEAIEVDIEALPDGELVLCVVGEDEKGQWQPYDLATRAFWEKLTGALSAPEEVLASPNNQSVRLSWSRPENVESVLVVRSLLPVEWRPEDAKAYEVSTLEDGLEIVYVGDASDFLDEGLVNATSYHYALFSVDKELVYSPAVKLASIPDVNLYSWIKAGPGAYLKNAVVGGRRADDSRDLYICRVIHLDGAGVPLATRTGKFVPAQPGDLSSGDCYTVLIGESVRVQTDYEILVISRGSLKDALQWTPVSTANQPPAVALDAATAGVDQMPVYICRFKQNENFDVPGNTIYEGELLSPCQADLLDLRGPGSAENFEILIRKSL